MLNLARLYSESGDLTRAKPVLEAVPVDDRSAKMEYALGRATTSSRTTRRPSMPSKAFDMEPDNLDSERGLGQAC